MVLVQSSFQQLSAVSSGINDVKAIIDKAGNLLKLTGK
jgi:replication-associated recombination protein RarA